MSDSAPIESTSHPTSSARACTGFSLSRGGPTMRPAANEHSAPAVEVGSRASLFSAAGRAPKPTRAQDPDSSSMAVEDLYEDAPCGHLSLRADGEILRANRTLLSWTGYSAEELSGGKHFIDLLTAPGALLYETYCLPLLRSRGSLAEVALDLLCHDGTRLPILLSAGARVDASGASWFQIVIMNAPKRREYERELLSARTRAEEAAEELRIQRAIAERKMAEQDALLQAVGHMAAGDLETPIPIEASSELSSLALGLEGMRREILSQIRDMKERNIEILHLNAELRHQIEQRSRHLLDSMQSAMRDDPAEVGDASSEAITTLPRGTILANRYRIDAVLGRGAMGTVYEVERISDGRRYAAKVLSARPDSRAMARFAREALLLARLQHPNLIAIVDLDITTERMPYLVMELVHGKSLAELRHRYGDADFMLPVLGQIADALTTVHSAGIVHRDLKPANVLISVSSGGLPPTARLADFGISRLLDPDQAQQDSARPARVAHLTSDLEIQGTCAGGLDLTRDDPAQVAASRAAPAPLAVRQYEETLDVRGPLASDERPLDGLLTAPLSPTASTGAAWQSRPSDTLTQAGALVGTPLYMAPELLRGAKLAQPSSDIFSFGLMAYEVLTGTLPFAEPPMILVARDRSKLRFEPLDAACPGLPPELARLLERCLVVDPALRPTADALSRAFGALQIKPWMAPAPAPVAPAEEGL